MQKRNILLIGVIFLAVLVATSVLYGAWRWQNNKTTTGGNQLSKNDPIQSVEVLDVQDQIDTTSGTSGTEPSASPSPTVKPAVTQLPDSAKTIIANFYAAYKDRDASRLGQFFTPDNSDDLKSYHATLFTGKDLSGNPGGPTLFSTNTASQYASGYTIIGSAQQGGNWVVTIKEGRLNGSDKKVDDTTALMTLVPGKDSTSWSIDEYYRAGSGGKYNAFLTQ